jgi:large subunit ribosomal protein L2
MPMKTFKPYTQSRRFMTVEDFSDLTKKAPEKSLLEPLRKTGGRNNTGSITVRFRGGGHKRMYRKIDFKRDKAGVPATVAAIEYDPNRSSRIALLFYKDGEKRYILQPVGMKAGDSVMSGPSAEIRPGNALPLVNIPLGTVVHAVELVPGKGAQLARSAGVSVQIMAKENGYATLKMPSSEIRMVPDGCMATVGQVGNTEHENLTIGNAGPVAAQRVSVPSARNGHERGGSPSWGRSRQKQREQPASVALEPTGQRVQNAVAQTTSLVDFASSDHRHAG